MEFERDWLREDQSKNCKLGLLVDDRGERLSLWIPRGMKCNYLGLEDGEKLNKWKYQ